MQFFQSPISFFIHLFPTPHDALCELWVELPSQCKQSFAAISVATHSFIHSKMWNHTLTEMIKNGISTPVPSLTEEWEYDYKNLPRITYSSIFSYFVDSVACDGKAMSKLKSSEAYRYLPNSKVGRVLFKDVGNDFVYLNADVEPSQSLVFYRKAKKTVPSLASALRSNFRFVYLTLFFKPQIKLSFGCKCIHGQHRLFQIFVMHFTYSRQKNKPHINKTFHRRRNSVNVAATSGGSYTHNRFYISAPRKKVYSFFITK